MPLDELVEQPPNITESPYIALPLSHNSMIKQNKIGNEFVLLIFIRWWKFFSWRSN